MNGFLLGDINNCIKTGKNIIFRNYITELGLNDSRRN